jgi:hypothetical protein
MTYYDAPRGKGAEVKSLDPETFARLARQTDIVAGDGAAAARASGPSWPVRPQPGGAALEIYDEAQDAGFPARIRPRDSRRRGLALRSGSRPAMPARRKPKLRPRA